jgi:4-hydroxy-tetrahydrodipicolinate reductase
MDTVNVVQYGLGPIGNTITQFIAEKKHLSIVGGIDIDPEKVGKDVGELAGCGKLGVTVTDKAENVLTDLEADIAVLTTTSDLSKITSQILEIVSSGLNVVTTCEELSYPWKTDPERAKEIDEAAWKNKVSVLSTGVNPGFLMDFLPLAMTGICRNVIKVTVERIQDAQYRRIPFQKKIGAGLSPDEFAELVDMGTLRHVGLTESMHMIASALGWDLEKTEDIIEPVIADKDTETKAMTVPKGYARGVAQTGRAWMDGKEVISLIFKAAVGEPDPRDRIYMEGTPPIDSTIKGGVNGDIATCAITVNAIQAVVKARPGLRTMADISPISCFG